jgi:hypothetical protein
LVKNPINAGTGKAHPLALPRLPLYVIPYAVI